MNLSKKIFYILVFIIPFGFAINPFKSIDLNIIRLIIPIFFLIWLGESLFYKKIFIDTRLRFLYLLLFLIIFFLSFFWAPEKQRALRKILFIFSFFPLYLISFDLFKKNLSKTKLFKIIIFTSILQSITGIFQFFLQFFIGINASLKLWKISSLFFLGKNFSETVNQYPSWLVNLGGKTTLRAFGTFPDPHLFSLFISLSLPISWYFFKKTKKSFYLTIGIIQLTAIFLSFSRSSYLAVLFFLIIIFFEKTTNTIKNKKTNYIYIISFIIFLLLIFTPNYFSQRLRSSFNPNEGSNLGRIEMWKKSIEIIKNHPIKGVGIGNLSYFIKPSSDLREPIYAHNLFLDFGAENGIFSIILLFLIFLSPFLTSYLNKKNNDKKLIAYFFAIFFIFSFFETPFYSINIFPFFLIFLAYE